MKNILKGDILYKKDDLEEYKVENVNFVREITITINLPDDVSISDQIKDWSNIVKKQENSSFNDGRDNTYFSLKSKTEEIYKDYDYVIENFYTLSDIRENSINKIIY